MQSQRVREHVDTAHWVQGILMQDQPVCEHVGCYCSTLARFNEVEIEYTVQGVPPFDLHEEPQQQGDNENISAFLINSSKMTMSNYYIWVAVFAHRTFVQNRRLQNGLLKIFRCQHFSVLCFQGEVFNAAISKWHILQWPSPICQSLLFTQWWSGIRNVHVGLHSSSDVDPILGVRLWLGTGTFRGQTPFNVSAFELSLWRRCKISIWSHFKV